MFDEQPDGDPHGECAREIHKLEADLAEANSLAHSRAITIERMEKDLAAAQAESAQLKQMLFRVYDYVGVPDDKHSIWGPIRAVLIARGAK